MNVILKKSTIQFVAPPTPGQLVTIDPALDPSYSSGYAIKASNKIETTAYENAGVSVPIECDGYDKIIVTNAARQSYFCQLSFFDSTSTIQGHDGYTVEGNAGTENIEVLIPSGAVYVRFTTNVDTAGRIESGRVIQMRVAAVSE